MTEHPRYRSFNFGDWIERNLDNLRPPVCNRQLFDERTGMVVMIVGGPNVRTDFHDDPVEEFFYQLRGDMVLKIAENGEVYDVPIKEGDVFILPPHARHSPQRPIAGSVGLVVEGTRGPDDEDGFEWYCFGCGGLVHRVEARIRDIVKDLPPLYDAFYGSTEDRTCKNCGSVHPGTTPPEGWAGL